MMMMIEEGGDAGTCVSGELNLGLAQLFMCTWLHSKAPETRYM